MIVWMIEMLFVMLMITTPKKMQMAKISLAKPFKST